MCPTLGGNRTSVLKLNGGMALRQALEGEPSLDLQISAAQAFLLLIDDQH